MLNRTYEDLILCRIMPAEIRQMADLHIHSLDVAIAKLESGATVKASHVLIGGRPDLTRTDDPHHLIEAFRHARDAAVYVKDHLVRSTHPNGEEVGLYITERQLLDIRERFRPVSI